MKISNPVVERVEYKRPNTPNGANDIMPRTTAETAFEASSKNDFEASEPKSLNAVPREAAQNRMPI